MSNARLLWDPDPIFSNLFWKEGLDKCSLMLNLCCVNRTRRLYRSNVRSADSLDVNQNVSEFTKYRFYTTKIYLRGDADVSYRFPSANGNWAFGGKHPPKCFE